MILVDTSVWINHLRSGDATLVKLLNGSQVLVHPFVSGELACGNLSNRTKVLRLFSALPRAPVATHEEALFFIQHNELMGRGIGFIDVHLLAATALSGSARIWTRDKRLDRVAADLGLAYAG